MRFFRSLRVRLAFTFVAVGALLLTIGFAGVARLLDRAVWSPLDAALEEEAAGLALISTGDSNGAGENPSSDPLSNAVAQLGAEQDLGGLKYVLVSSPHGQVLASSGHVPESAALGAQPGPRFVREGDTLYRVVDWTAPDSRTISIGVQANRYAKTLARALWILALGSCALLGGIGFVAWSITTSAVREINILTAELESIEADSIARRLGPRKTVEVARLAEALNRLLARLETAVQGLQRFTADAAHELRTPLAALRAHLDVALARSPSADRDRDALLDVSEQTERLAVLAEDLLALSAIESTPPTKTYVVDLSALGFEVAEFLEPVAQEQGREFAVHIDPRALVWGETQLLKRLLLNLVGNAFKHTAPCVPVGLDIQRKPAEVVIVVRDEGAGIDDATRLVLFERFASPRRGQNGAGLGLAICRHIVLRHQGTIEVESRVDHGTTFTVRLPGALEPSEASGVQGVMSFSAVRPQPNR